MPLSHNTCFVYLSTKCFQDCLVLSVPPRFSVPYVSRYSYVLIVSCCFLCPMCLVLCVPYMSCCFLCPLFLVVFYAICFLLFSMSYVSCCFMCPMCLVIPMCSLCLAVFCALCVLLFSVPYVSCCFLCPMCLFVPNMSHCFLLPNVSRCLFLPNVSCCAQCVSLFFVLNVSRHFIAHVAVVFSSVHTCCMFAAQDIHTVDPNFLKLFKLAQLTIEYLLVCIAAWFVNVVNVAAMLDLLNCSSAFNTIDHPVLVHHLHTDFGFTDTVLQWFSSYLTDHTQYVPLSNHCSAFATVHSGVQHHSSFIGTLRFLCALAICLPLLIHTQFTY